MVHTHKLHTQLCHIPSVTYINFTHTNLTHNFVTYHLWRGSRHLVTSPVVSRGRRGTISHSPWFCVAGVAAGVALMALGGALGPDLVARDAAALCVAGVLGDIHLRLTWQAWHHLTFTLVLRGRRGTRGTGWRAWARFSRA